MKIVEWKLVLTLAMRKLKNGYENKILEALIQSNIEIEEKIKSDKI